MAAELPQTLSQALPPGTLLKEYSLLSVLGMGGFGITYLAADNYLHLKVAIKEYFPSSAVVRNQFSGAVALKSEQAQEEYAWGKDRFMREAQTLARFSHTNIVQVFRYFEGNGTCYMVMAYEEGQSLESALTDRARWDQQAMLGLLLPLLDGLESVHAAGFLHRDIKPANIVLRAKDGSPVLIDFGAARAPTSTDALTIVLSHGYGPPEQYSRQGNQGPWTDIYALAGVLYRIVSGTVPPTSLHRLKNDAMIPATLSGAGRFAAPFLEAIDRALDVDETRRPQNIAEFRKLLLRSASDRPTPTLAMAAATPASTSTTSPPVRPRTSRRLEEDSEVGLVGRIGQAMIAHPFLSLLFLVAALYGAAQFMRRSPAPPPAPPQAVRAASEPATPAPRPESSAATAAAPVAQEARPLAPASEPPGERAAQPAPVTEGERPRDIRREALEACAGKSIGAPCRMVTPRNETIDATCMATPEGALLCRPERIGPRPNDRPGVPPGRADTPYPQPIPRPPR